jgi:hypothetical protein
LAEKDNLILLFFIFNDVGILPFVSLREIAFDHTKFPPVSTYHLLVNSLATILVFVEFGIITIDEKGSSFDKKRSVVQADVNDVPNISVVHANLPTT